jgi:hypothetical protein
MASNQADPLPDLSAIAERLAHIESELVTVNERLRYLEPCKAQKYYPAPHFFNSEGLCVHCGVARPKRM